MPSPVSTENMEKGTRDGPLPETKGIRVRLSGWLGRWGADLLLAAGAALVSAGAGWIYPPAGLIAGGVLLMAGGVLAAKGGEGP